MDQFSKYVGLDVHKDSISIAIAGGGQPEFYGEISNRPEAISRLLKRMSPHGEVISYCYEAGPCGYDMHRWIKERGYECQVVAPSLMPRKPGNRVKTDRRDAGKLAEYLRSGELTAVWIPDEELEAIRVWLHDTRSVKHELSSATCTSTGGHSGRLDQSSPANRNGLHLTRIRQSDTLESQFGRD